MRYFTRLLRACGIPDGLHKMPRLRSPWKKQPPLLEQAGGLTSGLVRCFGEEKKSLAITENRTIAPQFSSPWCSQYSNCLSSVPIFSTGVKMTVSVKYCYLDVMEVFKIGFTCLNITNFKYDHFVP
jgi:hypothetical protein